MAESASPLLEQFHYFATPVYVARKPELVDATRQAALAGIKRAHGDNLPDKIHPFLMSDSLLGDPEIAPLADFVCEAAWQILASQGFAMAGLRASLTEMWCQEHHYMSSMEQHAHPGGNFIVGFYFVDVPEGAPRAVFHDPRPARMMLNLPEVDPSQATLASTMINFTPEPGMLLFAPAWLAHSFGRNASELPFRFVHFNLTVEHAHAGGICQAAEVV